MAIDDEHHARLRDTLLIFLQSGGSYKATAEQLTLHKNTVSTGCRKAEETGGPVGNDRHDVELALQASQWLGSSVLERAPGAGEIQGQVRKLSTSAANSAWCWNRNPCAESG